MTTFDVKTNFQITTSGLATIVAKAQGRQATVRADNTPDNHAEAAATLLRRMYPGTSFNAEAVTVVDEDNLENGLKFTVTV